MHADLIKVLFHLVAYQGVKILNKQIQDKKEIYKCLLFQKTNTFN